VIFAEVLTNQALQTPITKWGLLKLVKFFHQNQILRLKITQI